MSVISKYAGLYPNYQRLGEQQGQAIGGGMAQMLQILSQIVQQNQQRSAFEDQGFTKQQEVGAMPSPFFSGGAMPVPVQTQQPNVDWLSKNLDNPFVRNYAQAQTAFAPKTEQRNPYMDTVSIAPITGKETVTKPAMIKRTADKRLGQGTENGRTVVTMQSASDGSTYKIDLGESFDSERLKLAKTNVDLARQRLNSVSDRELKAEGKYLISKYDSAEKDYNRNMIYLSDTNLSESTRKAIEDQQISLANEMDAYGREINALGKTATQVISAPTQKPQPQTKPKQGAGEKIRVRRKSDGKTGTIDSKDFNASKYDKI